MMNPARNLSRLAPGVSFSFAAALLAPWPSAPAQQVWTELHDRSFPAEPVSIIASAVADFDRDGDRDLILASADSSGPASLFYLENRGRGHFVDRPQQLPLAHVGLVARIATGDVDGDGDLDVVLGVNRGKDLLLRNDGTGRFTDATTGNLDMDGGATADAVLVDLDGDGDLDLLLGSGWRQGSRIALNDGTGRFSDPPSPLLPSYSRLLTPLDADGDGDQDLALFALDASGTGVGARLLANDGTGKLTDVTAGRMPTVAVPAARMRAVDVDRDGDPDLVVATRASGSGGSAGVLVWINDGAGRFADQTATRMPRLADDFAELLVADLEGDGDQDLVVPAGGTSSWTGPISGERDRVLANDGGGRFTDVTAAAGLEEMAQPVGAAEVADLDGDGDVDVLLASAIGAVRLHLNDGSGRLRLANPRSAPEEQDDDGVAVAGDVDGDGDPDLITFGYAGRLLRNDGWGRLRDDTAGNLPAASGLREAAALTDVDGDGDLDLVVAWDTLLINDGTGRFTAAGAGRHPSTGPQATKAIAAADVDGDGDDDLVLAKFGDRQRLLRNDGTGTFTEDPAAFGTASAGFGSSVALGDLDGDGDLDAVFGSYDGTSKGGLPVTIWHNDGTGAFRRDTAFRSALRNTTAVQLADFDGDGDLDLFQAALAWCLNPPPDDSRLYLNDGRGGFTDVTPSHLPPLAEETLGARAMDVDADGDPDLVLTIAVALLGCGGINPQDRVLVNDGSARFADRTFDFLPIDDAFGSAVAPFDLDGDGDQELFVANVSHGSSARFARDVLLQNRFVHLDTPEFAQVGGSYTLELAAVRRPQPTGVLALPALSLVDARIPLGALGVLRLDLTVGIVAPPFALSSRGTGSVSYGVPNDPTLLGREVFTQAVIMTSGAPADWRLTNAVRDRVH